MLTCALTAGCSDGPCGRWPEWGALPFDGQVGVPPNAAFHVVASEAREALPSYQLIEWSSGSAVSLSVVEHRFGDWIHVAYRPLEPMETRAKYVVSFDGSEPILEFFTGQWQDTDLPESVEITGASAVCDGPLDSRCRVFIELPVSWEGGLYEIEVSQDEAFEGTGTIWSAGPSTYAGDHPCDGKTMGDYDDGKDLWMRVRAVDIAGNASAWSEVVAASSVAE